MNVGFYATKIQSRAMHDREGFESAYERFPESVAFWAMIDLVESSNYRIVNGPRAGYVRGESFFAVVRHTFEQCVEVRQFKEVGDAVMLACSTFRPLFETVVLVDQTCRQMNSVAGTDRFPFSIRAAIVFGTAKRLMRPQEDYLGSCLDELARLMNVRSVDTNLLLHDEAYRTAAAEIAEYGEFLEVGPPKQMGADAAKSLVKEVVYREMRLNARALAEFRRYFTHWR